MKSKFIAKLLSICMLICLIILFNTFTGCKKSGGSLSKSELAQESSNKSEDQDKNPTNKNRAEYEKQLKEVEKLYEKKPNDQDTAIKYGEVLYAIGEFDKAKEILSPYLKAEKSSPDLIKLLAQLEYLNGNYTEAEKLYKVLIKEYNEKYGLEAKAGLQLVYYQTNQYDKAKEELGGEKELENPVLDMMKSFDKNPYRINWNKNKETTIPFVTSDPLAIVPIEINGVKINAFIDTGGPMLTVDKSIAEKLGVKTLSSDKADIAGSAADISFGKTDSLKLGEVSVNNIPVMLTSFDGFKSVFDGKAENVHAIIGTNVLQQFIPIIDYKSGELTLVPRDEAGHKQLNTMLQNESVLEEVPFKISSTHYTFAKGSINGHKGLNMFVETGFADPKKSGISLSKETMDKVGIKMPKLEEEEEGSGIKLGRFNVLSYGLGSLEVKDSIGHYDTSDLVSNMTNEVGFVVDSLISYHYINNYKWVIDFDNMKMKFCK